MYIVSTYLAEEEQDDHEYILYVYWYDPRGTYTVVIDVIYAYEGDIEID